MMNVAVLFFSTHDFDAAELDAEIRLSTVAVLFFSTHDFDLGIKLMNMRTTLFVAVLFFSTHDFDFRDSACRQHRNCRSALLQHT